MKFKNLFQKVFYLILILQCFKSHIEKIKYFTGIYTVSFKKG
jgi:hypothetical protein